MSEPRIGHSDEYYLAMAALDQYERFTVDALPKSTSVVFRIHQLGHATERLEALQAALRALLEQWEAKMFDRAKYTADERAIYQECLEQLDEVRARLSPPEEPR